MLGHARLLSANVDSESANLNETWLLLAKVGPNLIHIGQTRPVVGQYWGAIPWARPDIVHPLCSAKVGAARASECYVRACLFEQHSAIP